MLRYVGAAAGWTLPGVPARDLEDGEVLALGLSIDELVASGCYVPDGADPLAAFNAARAKVTAGRGVEREEHPLGITAPPAEAPPAEPARRGRASTEEEG